jgi:hypothetical protein
MTSSFANVLYRQWSINEVRAWALEDDIETGKQKNRRKKRSYCILLTVKKTSVEHVNNKNNNKFIIIPLIRLFVTLLKVV